MRALIDNYNARPRGARLSFILPEEGPGPQAASRHITAAQSRSLSKCSPDSEPVRVVFFEYVVRTTGSSASAATGDLDAHDPTATTPAAQGL